MLLFPNKKLLKRAAFCTGLVLVLTPAGPLRSGFVSSLALVLRHPPDPYVPDLYQVDYEPALICIYNIPKKVDLSNTVGDYNRLTVLIYYIIQSKT